MVKLFKYLISPFLFGIQFILFSNLFGQVDSRKAATFSDAQDFYIDALSFASSDSLMSRVDLYVQIPYEILQFVKKDNEYLSQYEITVNFLAEDKSSVSEKMWSDELRVTKFDVTQSKAAYGLTQRSVLVPPGNYTLRAQMRDNESKKSLTKFKAITVANYRLHMLALSDLMLVNRVTSEGDKKSIVPNISGNIGVNNNSFSIFFEIYSPRTTDSLRLRYYISDYKNVLLLDKNQFYGIHGSRSQMIIRFDSTLYPTGVYTLTLEAVSLFDTAKAVATVKRTFVVQQGSMPVSISDLDLAIKQLRYIAKDNEYEMMEKADSDDEKRRLFEEFWRKRDPNPDTKRNEFMEEYYSRVAYANEHFSHYYAGWRTDMGMVYILFGSPNNVERHPFDINSKPYEVWSYYEYNRNVVFVDESGFGDYRLITPIYDMLQRLKY